VVLIAQTMGFVSFKQLVSEVARSVEAKHVSIREALNVRSTLH
jgi:hypothetical protein